MTCWVTARGKDKNGREGVAADSPAAMFVSRTRNAPIGRGEQEMKDMRGAAKCMPSGEAPSTRKTDQVQKVKSRANVSGRLRSRKADSVTRAQEGRH